MENCPGPAATWPCALLFGHGGDHERFLPEATETEVLAGVRRLREDRDALLAALKLTYTALGTSTAEPDESDIAALEAASAAIVKAER